MEQNLHSGLHKLCRVCGESLNRKGRVSYTASASTSVILKVFGVDVAQDDPQVHPARYCHGCRNVMYHSTKKGETYRPQVKIFQWSSHVEGCCPVCEQITAVEKGGRQKKTKRGRPSSISYRAAINHALRTAPPHNSTQEVAESMCPICYDYLIRPVNLTQCQMTVCCMCLVKWLEASQDLKCPCCYSDHLRDFSTIQSRASPSQVAAGYSNDKSTSTPTEHSAEQGKLPAATTNLTVGDILNRGLDVPLTQEERALQTKLVKRSLAQSPQNLLQIKTGGQVTKHTYTYSHRTCTHVHVHIRLFYLVQPVTLTPIPTPRVPTDKASKKTRHRRSMSLLAVREVVSGGSSSSQFMNEAKGASLAERQRLIEELQQGVRVQIPASESLAMKADLTLPWRKLRIVRR